jgi:NADH-quinone oxidoreductase subunit F
MRRIVAKRGRMEDRETLVERCKNIEGRTVCAFGDAEVAPIMSTLKHWRPEYITLIHEAEATNLIRPEQIVGRH